jgi:rhodanese-related sulfurtransferase
MWPLHREELLERAAARNGEPIAKFQKQSSKTPQRIDNVEACRTISTGLYSGMHPQGGRTKRVPKSNSLKLLGKSQVESSHGLGESLVLAEHRRSTRMWVILITLCFVALCVLILAWRHARDRAQMRQHSITAEELHSLLASNQEVLLFDVRQPLDLLAYPEIIPRAHRIPPKEVLEKPSLIPKEKDAVVYCTCPSDKTSQTILRRALALKFVRIKFLKGGLAAWKAMGYPVEPYREVFHLYVPSAAPPAG